jgi:hypothetical protein
LPYVANPEFDNCLDRGQRSNDDVNTRTNITGNVGNYTLPAGTPNDTSTAGVNVVGVTTGNLNAPLASNSTFTGSHDTINLEAHSEWIGGFNANIPGSSVAITGKGAWDNTSSIGSATIGVPEVSGTGVFLVGANRYGGSITFLKGTKVDAGQSVEIQGSSYMGEAHGDVEVKSPSLFHAAVQLGYGQLELDGLKGTSYSLKNDLLTIFNGNKVVDTLSVTPMTNGGPVAPIVVSQTSGGISIHADGSAYTGGGHVLPLHG